MPPTAVESCFEIAFWFLDRALTDGEYLQPQKMQRLMFLAQAYFGVVQNGTKLMPATFIAGEDGPLEPTIYRAFARGRPAVDLKPVDEVAQHVLDSVWRQFGTYSIEKLNDLVKRHPPYADAFAVGPASEIDFEAMVAFYGEKPGLTALGIFPGVILDAVGQQSDAAETHAKRCRQTRQRQPLEP